MKRVAMSFIWLSLVSHCCLWGQAKNVILFIGDGAGISSLNAASIFANGQPESLYIQRLPNASFRLQISTEAIAEFKVDTALFGADTGGTAGGQVEVISKSGTNVLHGSAFEYIRNNVISARGPFDPSTLPPFRLNQFGAGAGGPIIRDPNRVFNNHGSHDITAIDADSGKVVGTVAVSGDGEQTVSNGKGLLYVNLEDKSEVVAYDPGTLEVKQRFPLKGGKTHTGLAIDPTTNRLFSACRSRVIVVMDASDGHEITTLPIGAGVDYAAFDPGSKLVFASNGDGTLSIYHETSADSYEDAGTITTQPSAKTMAFDTQTKKIFLPAADVKVIPPAGADQKPTRKVKEGTFAVLVVAK